MSMTRRSNTRNCSNHMAALPLAKLGQCLGAGSSYEHLTYELHLSCTDIPRPLVFGRLDVKKLASQTVSSHQARTAKGYPFIKPIGQRRPCDHWHLVASGLDCDRSARAFTSLRPSLPSVSITIRAPWLSATAA